MVKANMKRGITGIRVGIQYLKRYLDECEFPL